MIHFQMTSTQNIKHSDHSLGRVHLITSSSIKNIWGWWRRKLNVKINYPTGGYHTWPDRAVCPEITLKIHLCKVFFVFWMITTYYNWYNATHIEARRSYVVLQIFTNVSQWIRLAVKMKTLYLAWWAAAGVFLLLRGRKWVSWPPSWFRLWRKQSHDIERVILELKHNM